MGNWKVISDSAGDIRFWAHRCLACSALCNPTRKVAAIWNTKQFDLIAWEIVAKALKTVPQMFQLWACKQVWIIAGTNHLRYKWDVTVESQKCPSCRRWKETSKHILTCREKGWTNFFTHQLDYFNNGREAGTDPVLHGSLTEHARGQGMRMLEDII